MHDLLHFRKVWITSVAEGLLDLYIMHRVCPGFQFFIGANDDYFGEKKKRGQGGCHGRPMRSSFVVNSGRGL